MIEFELVSPLPKALSISLMKALGEELEKVIKKKKKKIGVRFVSEQEIRSLNKMYRNKNAPTDVLSFETEPAVGMAKKEAEKSLGDLVVCPTFATKEAKRRSIPLQEELIRLLAHGTLHLAGFDHQTDAEEHKMFRLQEECVQKVLNEAI